MKYVLSKLLASHDTYQKDDITYMDVTPDEYDSLVEDMEYDWSLRVYCSYPTCPSCNQDIRRDVKKNLVYHEGSTLVYFNIITDKEKET